MKNTLRTRNDWRRIVAECRALRRANAALVAELKEWNTCPMCGGPVTRHGFQNQSRSCASETCDWSSSGAMLTEWQLAKLRQENAELNDRVDALLAENERMKQDLAARQAEQPAAKEPKVGEKRDYVDLDALMWTLRRRGADAGLHCTLQPSEARAILARIEDLEGRKDAGILAQRLGEALQRVAHLDGETARLAGERAGWSGRVEKLMRELSTAQSERDAARAEAKEQSRMRAEAQGELAALLAAVRWTSTSLPKEHAEVLRRAVEGEKPQLEGMRVGDGVTLYGPFKVVTVDWTYWNMAADPAAWAVVDAHGNRASAEFYNRPAAEAACAEWNARLGLAGKKGGQG